MNRSYPLHRAARNDVEKLTLLLVSRPEDVNAVDSAGRTPLHIAIECCQEECVSLLLSKGADVNVSGRNGMTPLHYAVYRKSLECGNSLLSKGADVNVSDSVGKTPLHYAVNYCNEKFVSLLLSKGANVNVSGRNGMTPLHYGMYRKSLESVSLFLSKGADVNVSDSEGKTPLHYAVNYCNEQFVSLLLSKGADVNVSDIEGKTPLHYAAKGGDEECVSLLLSKGADVNVSDIEGKTPLHYAAKGGDEECVSLLLSKGAGVNVSDSKGRMPLHYAAEYCGEACVSLLLSKGAGVNVSDSEGNTPLHYAVYRKSLESVSLFLSKGADVNVSDSEGNTPLHYAVYRKSLESVSLFLSKGADVNVSDSKGKTPLHYAVTKGNFDIIMLLAPYSTDVDVVNSGGESLLCTAVKQKNVEFVKLLLEKGASVEVRAYPCWSVNRCRPALCCTEPLHYAVEHKLIDIVRLLIPLCKNFRNANGETALHIAVRKRYGECVNLLLDCGVNVDVEDHYGQTPLHCALKNQDQEIAAMIISRSSNVNAIDIIGDSPLHIAVKQNDVESVNLLLRNGADVNINELSSPSPPPGGSKGKNENGRPIWDRDTSSVFSATYTIGGTPLHIAVKGNRLHIVELLLNNGANANAKDRRGWTPLHHSLPHGIEIGKLLIVHGADVNAASETGETVLHVAAKSRIYKSDTSTTGFVKQLLSRGGNIHACDQTGASPLHYATKHWQSPETLSLLIDSANVNSRNNLGETPLHVAIWESGVPSYESGSYRAEKDALKNKVKLFSENGFEINARTEHGLTVLHYAVIAGYEEVAKVIVERGGNANASTDSGLTPLHIAACTGPVSVAKFLLQIGANVDAISSDDNLRTLGELLKKKSTVHAIDFFDGGELTPLHLAVMAGNDQMVKLLLEHGANVDALDKNGNTPLYIASKSSRVAIVGHIIRHCPDLHHESNGRSVRAAVTSCTVDQDQSDRTRFRDDSSILDMLIQYGFTVAQEDKSDVMLLHTAVERGHLRFVEEVLKSNTDRSILNLSQQASVTPLHIAAQKGRESIVALLLSSGADVNAVDRDGNTPLFYTTDFNIAERLLYENAKAANCTDIWFAAIGSCRITLVGMLLQKSANANARNKDGMTALHLACSRSSLPVVNLLLDQGADVELKCSKKGYTALHIAAGREDCQDIIVLLLDHGADIDSLSEPVAQSTPPASRGAKSGGPQKLARRSGTQQTEVIAKTPLCVAVESGFEKNVRTLLAHGADINIRCGDCTPLMYAERKHAEEEEKAQSPEYWHNAAKAWAKDRVSTPEREHSWNPDRYRNYEDYEDCVIAETERAYEDAYDGFFEMHDSRWSGELITEFSRIAVELKRHMVLLKNVNIFVYERDLKTRDQETIDLCSKTESECKNELSKLQKTKMGTSNITMYDFLSMKQSDCAALYKEENMGEILSCGGCTDVLSFENYGKMIKYRLVIAREWPGVSSKAILVLADVFPMLPSLCLEKITDFMGYSDLKRLCVGTPPM